MGSLRVLCLSLSLLPSSQPGPPTERVKGAQNWQPWHLLQFPGALSLTSFVPSPSPSIPRPGLPHTQSSLFLQTPGPQGACLSTLHLFHFQRSLLFVAGCQCHQLASLHGCRCWWLYPSTAQASLSLGVQCHPLGSGAYAAPGPKTMAYLSQVSMVLSSELHDSSTVERNMVLVSVSVSHGSPMLAQILLAAHRRVSSPDFRLLWMTGPGPRTLVDTPLHEFLDASEDGHSD
ncbi:UNVERIFIED_CONTAM: hypothetical protein K2H54_062828 [Gekko kuhli]